MNPVVSDLINYGVPLLAGIVGVFAGHKLTLAQVKKALAQFGPDLVKFFEKLLADAKLTVTAPVKAVENAPGAIEAHHAQVQNTTLEVMKYALVGLTGMQKAYNSMNDAEKYALAQFISNSLPADLKVQPKDIVNGIQSAQQLLDETEKNPLLQKALELTQLAAAVNTPGSNSAPVQAQDAQPAQA